MNTGHIRKDGTWSLLTSGPYLEVILFYLIKKGLLKCGLYLQDGSYLEVALNTGLTVYNKGFDPIKMSPLLKSSKSIFHLQCWSCSLFFAGEWRRYELVKLLRY